MPNLWSPARYVPDHDKFCITEEWTNTIYDCVERNLPVPISKVTTDYSQNFHGAKKETPERVMENSVFHSWIAKENTQAQKDKREEEIEEEELDTQSWKFLNQQEILHKNNQIDINDCSIYTTEPVYMAACSDRDKIIATSRKPKNKEKVKTIPLNAPDKETARHYLDKHDHIESTICYEDTMNPSVGIGASYLGRISRRWPHEINMVEALSMDHNCHAEGKLIDGTKFRCLFDTGCTSALMTLKFYKDNPVLHKAPKFKSTVKSITVGNGQTIPVQFIVPVQMIFEEHRFEFYCLVLDAPDTNQIVIGIKEMYELEASLNTRSRKLEFMNRAAPVTTLKKEVIPPGEERHVQLAAQFCKKLTGKAIMKILLPNPLHTLMVEMKNNAISMYIMNRDSKPLILPTEEVIGVIDTRSLGYFTVQYEQLENHLKEKYHFPKANEVKTCLNRAIHTWNKAIPSKQVVQNAADPYPWLEEEDKRRNMSDEEILDQFVDLSKSVLNNTEKKELRQLLHKYKEAFSLRDEIGECPDMKIDIEVIDDTPFWVRPFPIAESDKPIMDKQMKRLVALGILTENSTSHTSPVMLITRKLTSDKRPVVDFRVLNTRILRRNTATPLMRDIFTSLGKSGCEVMSCVDLKDAYHSIPLTEKAKEYCGIMPYFGSPHFRYEVLPMGLSISPAKWMEYVNILMKDIPVKENYIAIMDDILCFSKTKDHWERIEDLLKAIIKHGLKLSPKKCQLFRDELLYMGNTFSTKNGEVSVKALKTRIEAMNNTPTPRTTKEVKSFCGVVNYLALFCPDLQLMLKPLYDLTRKDRPFVWTETHTKAFEAIKKRLMEPPVLHCPTSTGRFVLYSDTSRHHVGSSLWQMQEGKPKLIGYASKTLVNAAQNYSVTELEMTGLLKSMELWQYWLGSNEFDSAVDHKAIVSIVQAKTPPATTRIASLLEKLTRFKFRLYYVKGKDLKLADYLSRLALDKESPKILTPISFHPRDVLQTVYKDMNLVYKPHWNITTRSRAKMTGEIIPEVHGAQKALQPDVKPEYDRERIEKQQEHNRLPKIAPIKRPENRIRQQLVKRSCKQLNQKQKEKPSTRRHASNNGTQRTQKTPNITQQLDDTIEQPDTAEQHLDRNEETMRPPHSIPKPTPPQQNTPQGEKITREDEEREDEYPIYFPQEIDLGSDPDGPFHEELVEQEYRRPKKTDFQTPSNLAEQIPQDAEISQHLPKQINLDKLMRQIKGKFLRETHLPITLRDLEAEYLKSPQFRDIYLYLKQNKQPKRQRKATQVQANAFGYVLLDKLLFKIRDIDSRDPYLVLCIPTSKVEILLHYYHSSLLGGHMGIHKCCLTVKEKFHCPNFEAHARAYITGCHLCQQFKDARKKDRPFQKRVNLNTESLAKISMDIKYMPEGFNGYKYILILLCEVSNFVVACPLKSTKAEEVCDALWDNFIKYFGSPTHIICDKDPAFTSSLFTRFSEQFGIHLLFVSPTNHKSLLAEHGIKSISNNIMKHLQEQGRNWPKFCGLAMLNHNSSNTPNLDGMSPIHLVLGHKMKLIPQIEIEPSVPLTGTFTQYFDKVKMKVKYLRDRLHKFRDVRHDLRNSDKQPHSFSEGQIVYLYHPKGAALQTGTRKIANKYVGPLVIYKVVSPTQFILMSLDGKIYPTLIEETRIKEGSIWTTKGLIKTLAQLRRMLMGCVLNLDSEKKL